jgi:hypothetical protein
MLPQYSDKTSKSKRVARLDNGWLKFRCCKVRSSYEF